MREQDESIAPASLLSLDFSYAHSLKCTEARQKKSDRSMSIHRGCSLWYGFPQLIHICFYFTKRMRHIWTCGLLYSFPRSCQLVCQNLFLQNRWWSENIVDGPLSLLPPTELQEKHWSHLFLPPYMLPVSSLLHVPTVEDWPLNF